MNKIISDNLGVLLLTDTKISGLDLNDNKVIVNKQKLLMPSVQNSVIITNRLVIRELLNKADKDSNQLVLGRTFMEKREQEIKDMIKIQLAK